MSVWGMRANILSGERVVKGTKEMFLEGLEGGNEALGGSDGSREGMSFGCPSV